MNRTPLLLAGAAALALVASACSSARPDAATVNGQAIERADLEAQLRAYADNEPYRTAIASSSGTPILGPGGEGTVSMDFTARILRREILLELVRQEVEARKLTPSPEIVQQAQDQAKSFTLTVPEESMDAAWNAFPQSFRDQAVDDTTNVLALTQALGGSTDAELQARFDRNPDAYGGVCAAHILVESEEAARDVAAQLAGGADFAELAASVSTDTGSGEQGGLLYEQGTSECPSALGYVPQFMDGAAALAIGEVSEPIQSQFGWHIIRVDKRTPVTFDEVKDALREYVSSQANQAVNQLLTEKGKGDIVVSPRFGTWDPASLSVLAPGQELPTTTTAG